MEENNIDSKINKERICPKCGSSFVICDGYTSDGYCDSVCEFMCMDCRHLFSDVEVGDSNEV
ncbi:hypothetical protein UT300012_24640 [Paraclostridium bifermentans]